HMSSPLPAPLEPGLLVRRAIWPFSARAGRCSCCEDANQTAIGQAAYRPVALKVFGPWHSSQDHQRSFSPLTLLSARAGVPDERWSAGTPLERGEKLTDDPHMYCQSLRQLEPRLLCNLALLVNDALDLYGK